MLFLRAWRSVSSPSEVETTATPRPPRTRGISVAPTYRRRPGVLTRRSPSIMLFLPWYFNRSLIVLGSLPATVKSAMYPSRLRMPAMLSLILEWGISTAGSNARLELGIRASMSEIGSFIDLPTGFGHARNQPVEGGFAERHARAAELAEVAVAAAAHRAAVDHPGGAGVTRELGQPGVVAFGLQLSPNGGVLLDRFRLPLVAFNPCYLSHKKLHCGSLLNCTFGCLGLSCLSERHAH